MPEKSYIIRLSDFAFIFVYFLTKKGEVGKFVVKLNILLNDEVLELARYDSGMHAPHLDILHPDGSKKRVVDYSMLPKLSDSWGEVPAQPCSWRAGINPAPTFWVNHSIVGAGFTPARLNGESAKQSLNLGVRKCPGNQRAIEDFSNNWEFYWERWQRWLAERK